MWDFDLQMRFWKSSSDAMFGFAAATVAATAEWQDRAMCAVSESAQVRTSSGRAAAETSPFDPMGWWAKLLKASAAPMPFAGLPYTGVADFGSPLFQFAPAVPGWQNANPFAAFNPFAAMTQAFSPFARPAPTTGFGMPDMMSMAQNWQKMWQPLSGTPFSWTPFSWTMYQWPMTAMLMSAGMPHSVAAPTAQASTASLDAFDAAREQAERIFSAYRSDGGHASAQVSISPVNTMLAFMPWLAPAFTPLAR